MTVTPRDGRCPSCRYVFDMAAAVSGDAVPVTGDATICLNCGHLMIFTVFGTRSAHPDEVEEIMAERPDVVASIAHIRARGFIPHYRR